jgi:putative salt-induced outer membrane protein YdiY
MRKIIGLLYIAAITVSISTNAFAGCNPETDPCAPKKVIGAWEKSIAAGFNLTDGNTETTLLNIGLNARKEDTNGNIFEAMTAFNYGTDKAAEASTGDDVTRNDVRGNARYDRLLDDSWYLGLGSSFLSDDLADIDYRVTVDPSPGYYFIKNDDYKFRVEAGPSYLFEQVGGESDNYFAPRVAQRFDWVLSCTSKFYEKAEVLFDISNSDNYIINSELGVEAALATNLALVFTVRDVYDNVPAAGREKNDLQTITSLKVAL